MVIDVNNIKDCLYKDPNDTRERVYVSGSIKRILSDNPDGVDKCSKAFGDVADHIVSLGYFAINPFHMAYRLASNQHFDWDSSEHMRGLIMRYDLMALMTCDYVVVFGSWWYNLSFGVATELATAISLAIPVLEYDQRKSKITDMPRMTVDQYLSMIRGGKST